MAKKTKELKIKRTETLYYRMLIVLAALIAVVFSITYFTGSPDESNNFTVNIAPKIALGLGVLCIPALIFFFVKRAHGADERMSVLSSSYILVLAVWLTSIYAFYTHITSIKLVAYILVTSALYFIYYLFSREFFVFSLYTAIGAGLLVLINSSLVVSHIVLSVLIALVSALAIMLVMTDRKKPVIVKIGKSKFSLTDGTFKLYPFCISAGIMLAGVILSFVFGSMAFYSLIVLFVYYLTFTVINTVKMM